MGFWLTAAILAVSFIGLYFLSPRPKTQTQKPGTLDDFDFPTAREGSPVPMIWGRVKVLGPNVIYHGGLEAQAQKTRVKSGLFSSKRVTVGYNYRLTLQICLGIGQNMKLYKIWFGDRILWDQNLAPKTFIAHSDGPRARTASESARYPWTGEHNPTDNYIVIPWEDDNVEPWNEFYGKEGQGGYVGGYIRFQNGAATQRRDLFMEKLLPAEQIAHYRHFNVVTFLEFFLGESTTPQPVYFEVDTYPSSLGFPPIGQDCNPIEIIWDILTNPWGGLGEPAATFDRDAFLRAGMILQTEQHGMSLVLSRPNEAGQILEEILNQIDGILLTNELGLVSIELVRPIEDLDSIPSFDEEHIIEILEYNQADWSSTINQVRVSYIDRDNEYQEKTAMVQDSANISIQQKVVSSEYKFPGIKSARVAHQVASRELRLLSIPLISLRIRATQSVAQLPGRPMKISWEEYGLEDLVLRVQKVDYGNINDPKATIDLVQDAYSLYGTVFTPPPPTEFVPPPTITDDPSESTPFTKIKNFELHYWLAKTLYDADETEADGPENLFLEYMAARLDTGMSGLIGEVLESGTPATASASGWRRDTEDAEFPIYGKLLDVIPQDRHETGVTFRFSTGDIDPTSSPSVVLPDTQLFRDIKVVITALVQLSAPGEPQYTEGNALLIRMQNPTPAVAEDIEKYLTARVTQDIRPRGVTHVTVRGVRDRLRALIAAPATTPNVQGTFFGESDLSKLFLVGDEIFYFTRAVPTIQPDKTYIVEVRANRAYLDTRPVEHEVGEDVWIFGELELNNMSIQAIDVDPGDSYYVRLAAERATGVITNYTYEQRTNMQRVERPAPVDDVSLNGMNFPDTVSTGVAGNFTVRIYWLITNRKNPMIAHRQHPMMPEDGTTYEAEWTIGGGNKKSAVLSASLRANQRQMQAMLNLEAFGEISLDIYSKRNGLRSHQPYHMEFTLEA